MVAKIIDLKQKRKEKMIKRAMTVEELQSLMPSIDNRTDLTVKVERKNVSANN